MKSAIISTTTTLMAIMISVANCASLLRFECNEAFVKTDFCVKTLTKFSTDFTPGPGPGSVIFKGVCSYYSIAATEAFIDTKTVDCLFRCKYPSKCVEHYS